MADEVLSVSQPVGGVNVGVRGCRILGTVRWGLMGIGGGVGVAGRGRAVDARGDSVCGPGFGTVWESAESCEHDCESVRFAGQCQNSILSSSKASLPRPNAIPPLHHPAETKRS